eukprot:5178668-Pyramimonas_sp.AAC.1
MVPVLAAAEPQRWKSSPPIAGRAVEERRDMGPGDHEGRRELGKSPARARCGRKKDTRGSIFRKACGRKLAD